MRHEFERLCPHRFRASTHRRVAQENVDNGISGRLSFFVAKKRACNPLHHVITNFASRFLRFIEFHSCRFWGDETLNAACSIMHATDWSHVIA
jgi:hypothetical protein